MKRIESKMSAKHFKNILTQLDYTQKDAATMLGISVRSVNDYANGMPIPKSVANHIRLLESLAELVKITIVTLG